MTIRAAGCLVTVFLVAACAGGGDVAPSPDPGAGGTVVRADKLGLDRAPRSPSDRQGAVTMMGRTVLKRSHHVYRGRVVRIESPLAGMEMAEVRVLEPFFGDLEEDQIVRVYCGERERLPRPGQQGVLFVARRADSLHPHLVEVAPLDDRDGGPRLQVLKAYLAIEQMAPRPRRLQALLVHLRVAVTSANRWTRHSAIREYAALSDREPEVLTAADARALSSARLKTREPEMTRLVDAALSAVRSSTPVAARSLVPEAGRDPSKVSDGLVRRFQAAPDAFDRQAVLDDAARRGPAARAVIRLGLADPDPAVRASAAEAAVATRDAELGAELHAVLLEETELPVRGRLVRAVGMAGFDGARSTLVAIAQADGRLSREALFALARIRTPGALADLEKLSADGADEERRKLIAFLVSDAFLEQEKRLERQ